ncbi:MAG: DUF262 domain-containing protein [Flavobacterium sp.]|nr:MAG: DUF262 domain-containing protein [Flavobacterium sp.]
MSSTPPAGGPTAQVPKDPQPSVDRVEDLAKRILSADILLPKFQRNFVWERRQILLLWDSIANGFPLGSILLWQSRQELRSESNIADLDITPPKADYPVNYLLDGQQRLSTICGAIYWRGGNAKSPWNIAFDLRSKKFLHLETLEDPPQHQIRVNKLSDASEYFKHVYSLDTLNSPDKDLLKKNAEEFFNRFKDYKIASVTLGDMSITDVAPIFERINSQGTPLTIVDLMRAATWSPQFDLIDNIDKVLDELSAKNFDKIEKKALLRSLSAAVGGGFSVESIDQLRNCDVATLQKAIDEVSKSYKKSADFLTTQLKVPSAEIIPYQNQLVVLSEIFRRLSTPSAHQYKEISKWFWRSSLASYFSGWNTGAMSEDLKSLSAFCSGTNNDIQLNSSAPNPTIWSHKRFRMNAAHAKLLAIVLSMHNPKDLLTGQVIDTAKALAWENSKEYHHFFPQKYLEKKGYKGDQINSLANMVFLSSTSNKTISDSAPSAYLARVAAAAGPDLSKWLESNLINDKAYQAAMKDDYETFMSERAAYINDSVKKLAGW